MNVRSWWKILAPLAVVATASLAINAVAQEAAAADAKKDEPVQLEKYVVTGSYIPWAADATAIPVKIITFKDIEDSGESGDLLEVIRKTMPQFVGNSNLGSSNGNISSGNTNGGSQIKLRNVQTLVLINGRRAAFAPVSATGGFTFVDVDSIPVSAVAKIEVLSDGASALYGSDAVSGVVNIILKSDYQGVEIGGGYKVATQEGHWSERSARFIAGAHNDKTSITVSGEWLKSDPMFESQRVFSADQTGKTGSFPGAVNLFAIADGTTFAGDVLLSTKLNAPPLSTKMSGEDLIANGTYTGPIDDITLLFNLSKAVTLKISNERKAATIVYDSKLTDNLKLFGDVLLANTKTYSQLNAQPIVGMPFAAAHVSDFGFGVGFTDPDHPQNPFNDYVLVRNRFIDHPRGYASDNKSMRIVTGLRGKITDNLSFETAVNLNWVNQKFRNTNVIDRPALAAAIDAGTINLFAYKQADGAIESSKVLGVATSDNKSTLKSWDGRLNGEIPHVLPGGPIGYAVGAEYRKETLSATPDAGSYTILDPTNLQYGQPARWDGATSADPFNKGRSVKSLFAEIRIPLVSPEQKIDGVHLLEIDAAGRYDRYSDTDDPVVPKVSIRYLPVDDQFALRASYTKSFTAPDLFALFGPAGVGNTDTIIDFKRLDGTTIAKADQAFLRLPSNPSLQPEKANSFSGGFIYSPRSIKGFVIEANYFNIRQTNIIGNRNNQEILQDVETLGAASKYASQVKFGGFFGTPVTAPGDVSAAYDSVNGSFISTFLTNYSENFVSASQDGVDLNIDYTKQIDSIGKWNVGFSGLWYNSSKVDGTEYVGATNGSASLNGGTIPRWRGTIRTSLEHNRWQLGVSVEHIPGVMDTAIDPSVPVASFTRVDISGRYRFPKVQGKFRFLGGLTLRVGINNLFDRMPPLAPNAWTDSNADTGTYGDLGRVVYMDASYKF